MKVVINTCYGGFGISEKAARRYSVIKYGEDRVIVHGEGFGRYLTVGDLYCDDIARDDPALVQAVEELGVESYGDFAKLYVQEIPDGSEWEIEEYDGQETLREPVKYY